MTLLDIVLVILILSWLGGFAFQIGGGLIHLLLVIALIGLIFRIFGVRTN